MGGGMGFRAMGGDSTFGTAIAGASPNDLRRSLLSFEFAAKKSSLAFVGARESLLKMAEEGVLARRWWFPWWWRLWQVME